MQHCRFESGQPRYLHASVESFFMTKREEYIRCSGFPAGHHSGERCSWWRTSFLLSLCLLTRKECIEIHRKVADAQATHSTRNCAGPSRANMERGTNAADQSGEVSTSRNSKIVKAACSGGAMRRGDQRSPEQKAKNQATPARSRLIERRQDASDQSGDEIQQYGHIRQQTGGHNS